MVYFVIARILVNIIGSLGGAVDMVIDHKHNPTDMSLYPILATRVKASSHLSKVAVDMVIDHKHNSTDVSLYPILATRVEASSHLSKVAVDMVIDHKHNPTDMSLYPILATRVKASSHLSKVRCFTGHFVIPLLVDFFPLHYV
jgi:hypothetical protein